MMKEYTNRDVYDFLAEECRCNPELWNEFGEGIISHSENPEFWESLSEQLDCLRVCDGCGKPMIEGYVVYGDSTYCSEECRRKKISDEEYEELSADDDGDTYWITWYEDSMTYKRHRANS